MFHSASRELRILKIGEEEKHQRKDRRSNVPDWSAWAAGLSSWVNYWVGRSEFSRLKARHLTRFGKFRSAFVVFEAIKWRGKIAFEVFSRAFVCNWIFWLLLNFENISAYLVRIRAHVKCSRRFCIHLGCTLKMQQHKRAATPQTMPTETYKSFCLVHWKLGRA